MLSSLTDEEFQEVTREVAARIIQAYWRQYRDRRAQRHQHQRHSWAPAAKGGSPAAAASQQEQQHRQEQPHEQCSYPQRQQVLTGVDSATAAALLQHMETGGSNMGLSEEEYADLRAALLQVQQGSVSAAGQQGHTMAGYHHDAAQKVDSGLPTPESLLEQQHQPYVELREVVVQPGLESQLSSAVAACGDAGEGSGWGRQRTQQYGPGDRQFQQHSSWQQQEKHQSRDAWPEAQLGQYMQEQQQQQGQVEGYRGQGQGIAISPREAREQLRMAEQQQHPSAGHINGYRNQQDQQQQFARVPRSEGQEGPGSTYDVGRNAGSGGGSGGCNGGSGHDEGLARGSLTGEKLRSLLCYLDSVEQEAEAEGRQGTMATTGLPSQAPQ